MTDQEDYVICYGFARSGILNGIQTLKDYAKTDKAITVLDNIENLLRSLDDSNFDLNLNEGTDNDELNLERW